jgi:hypothetical protein
LGGQTQAKEAQEVFNGSPEKKNQKPFRGEGDFFYSPLLVLLL